MGFSKLPIIHWHCKEHFFLFLAVSHSHGILNLKIISPQMGEKRRGKGVVFFFFSPPFFYPQIMAEMFERGFCWHWARSGITQWQSCTPSLRRNKSRQKCPFPHRIKWFAGHHLRRIWAHEKSSICMTFSFSRGRGMLSAVTVFSQTLFGKLFS